MLFPDLFLTEFSILFSHLNIRRVNTSNKDIQLIYLTKSAIFTEILDMLKGIDKKYAMTYLLTHLNAIECVGIV